MYSTPLNVTQVPVGAHNNGLWCTEAEEYVLAHAPRLEQDS